MDEKLTIDSLEKAYAQTTSGWATFSKKVNSHPRKKQALAGVTLTLTPGTEFGPQFTNCVRLNFSQDHKAAVAAMERFTQMIDRYRA